MNPSLLVIGGFLAIALVLGLLARRGRTMTLEQWSVGGRGFGTLFVFLLMAGEIYTTFTFLGASGWAYGRGAPAFYILAYGAIAYTISYFLLPPIWHYAAKHHLHSQADFFASKLDSRTVGVVVGLVGVAATIPYLVLQLKGLGIIVSEASSGAISVPAAVWISVVALVAYVMVSGVHGSAWTAVLKDIMILAVVVALGIWLPWHYYGGVRPMFAAIEHAHPGFLRLPAHGMSPSWFVSTVLLSALGFYMWPGSFASAYTARDPDVFRRNAALMPLYQLVMLFALLIGFAAILRVPGLAGDRADLALLRLSRQSFGPWTVGLIGAAGLLTALVPGSVLLMSGATILVKNVWLPFAPQLSERARMRAARAFVPVLALAAVLLTLKGGTAIVQLLLVGYNVITQLFPAALLCLPERPLTTRAGALAGILTGEAVVALVQLTHAKFATLLPGWPAAITDLNIGIVALAANTLVLLVVSAVTRRSAPAPAR